MTPEDAQRDRKALEVFGLVIETAADASRAAILQSACAGDDALKARVEALLASHVGDTFLEEPAVDVEAERTAVTVPLTEKPGDVFGPYTLLEQIGEGGFGVVWMAEQSEPILRTVALKVVKPGMDTKQVLARFEAERQALAMMDHPNIARVLDAGATPAGRPYFAMELVKGIPITEFCDKRRLDTRQRLELFCDVCSAVNHAHQKGVIHRDLKPSNVMVSLDGDHGVAKVIDFGIAKATDLKLTDKTLFTQFAQFLGTPVYMSPEQAAMGAADIDTRSDIYSLGMLLYELLAGRPAFDPKTLMGAGYDEMRRIIKEDEPPRPSATQRLTQVHKHGVPASAGAPPPPSGTPNIPSDLDWIVMKAIEKARSRRYETANGLAADIQRHLTNEPVMARPASTAYRFQKALRRNKLAFSAAAAVAVTLIAGLIVSTWQALEARRERQRAEKGESAARTSELAARQIAYASDMNLAHQAVQDDDFHRALQLLNRHRPKLGVPALGVPPLGGASDASAEPSPDRLKPGLRTSDRLKAGLQTDLRGWEWRYLWRQCQGEERFVLGEHTGGATAVGMLADGKTVFSAGRDKCVRLWDLESRSQIGLLPHAEEVIGAAASPDGRWLATATMKDAEGQPVLLWDLATHKIEATLTSEFYLLPGSITFSPDSKWLAFATVWGGVRLWNVDARSEVANLPAAYVITGPRGVAFSLDSRTLAYTENDFGAIVLWDIASRSVSQLKGHQSAVTALAFSPDGETLASGSHDRTARLWNVAERRERFPFSNHSGGVTSMAFSPPDGQTLAMSGEGGAGRVIRLVEVATGKERTDKLRGHRADISSLAFAPDGQTLVSAGDDGTIRVWDPVLSAKEKPAHEFSRNSISIDWSTYGPALCLSPDGRHLLTVYTDQTFSLWDTLRRVEGERHPLPFPDTTIAAVAPGGRLAAFASRTGEVRLWDAETGEARFFAQPVTKGIHRLVFSPDGRYLAVADGAKARSEMSATAHDPGRTVRVWEVSARKETHVLSPDGAFPVSMTFSADSKALMAGCWKGSVKLWQLDRPGEPDTFHGDSWWVGGLALLPDGQTLISAETAIRFWDIRSRHENALKLSPRAGEYHCLALSADGRRFAAGASDGRITIWDVASHQAVATFEGHEESVRQLAFTPDGDHLVSVSKDQLRVWRAAAWSEADAPTELQKLNPH